MSNKSFAKKALINNMSAIYVSGKLTNLSSGLASFLIFLK